LLDLSQWDVLRLVSGQVTSIWMNLLIAESFIEIDFGNHSRDPCSDGASQIPRRRCKNQDHPARYWVPR
jgi:hypothetical protein